MEDYREEKHSLVSATSEGSSTVNVDDCIASTSNFDSSSEGAVKNVSSKEKNNKKKKERKRTETKKKGQENKKTCEEIISDLHITPEKKN
eukprot:3933939-Ditylum_brightwellii.AAC.1